MKKILITGSNGLLGQKLVYALKKWNDVETIATALGTNRLIDQQGYIYEPMNIVDQANVEAVIKKYQPDVIINTAAMTNVDACESKREECWALNVSAVEYMIDAIKKHSPQAHFIHLSTDFIFDGEKGSAYTEEDTPNPLSYYALSKWEAEKRVQNSGIKWAIGRTIIVFGIVDNMSRSNIVLWAKDALTKGQKINVVDDQFRSPTLAEDLAQGCILIADKGATGIYNLAGPDTFSILDLVYKVADFWKLDKSLVSPSKSNTLNQPAKRPPRTGLIIDKARKELGYAPHTFEQGLKILDEQLKAFS
ncbi:MAG: NAD(P)-dependent oxidoreductase [Bacteroidetes bacterium]|nr:NAD(P)-dependent oxidoreductase [Bacteroidota bacterium]